MGALGFMGIMVIQNIGGGMDTISYTMEELSKIDASASVVSVNNSLVCYGIEPMAPKNKNKNTSPN